MSSKNLSYSTALQWILENEFRIILNYTLPSAIRRIKRIEGSATILDTVLGNKIICRNLTDKVENRLRDSIRSNHITIIEHLLVRADIESATLRLDNS